MNRLTKDYVDKRKEILKANISVSDVLLQHGVKVRNGRCKSICHEGTNYTAKVSHELYYCFKCGKSMDIFDATMYFNNCDFITAFELLGGNETPSFTATVKANRAKKERDIRIVNEQKDKLKLRQIQICITAYRNVIATEKPLSDLWCYCVNQLQYQLHLYEHYMEKRWEFLCKK